MSDDPGAVYSGPFPIHPADKTFYAQAGACLLEWAEIDSVLFNICTIALGVEPDIALIVYSRTPTVDSRLSLTAELIYQRFPTASGSHPHDLVRRVKAVSKRVRDLADIRNKIAHGGRSQITHMYAGPDPAPLVGSPGFHSVVSPSKFKNSDGTRLDLAGLRDYQRAVFTLGVDLRQYRSDLQEALHV